MNTKVPIAAGATLYWKKQTVWNNDGDAATVLDSTGSIIGTMDCP